MTTKHRNRLLLAVTLGLLVIGAMAGAVTASQGVGAGLAVFGFAFVAIAIMAGIAWYIMSSNDRHAQQNEPAPPS